MKIIDKRQKATNTTFDDLCVGDCFIDEEGDICIKTGKESCIYTIDHKSWNTLEMQGKEKVILLEATLTVIGKSDS